MALGLLAFAILALVWLKTGRFHFSAIIGYLLGSLSFAVLVEGFVALEKAPAWFNVPALIFSNLKLLFLALLVYVLHLLGFSVVEIIIGIFVSQLGVLFSLTTVLYLNHKNADNR